MIFKDFDPVTSIPAREGIGFVRIDAENPGRRGHEGAAFADVAPTNLYAYIYGRVVYYFSLSLNSFLLPHPTPNPNFCDITKIT